jgi:hypothetical protein
MKNFYEATVINPTLKLKMVLELKAIGICPCQIFINNNLEFYGGLIGTNIFIKELDLTAPITIEIKIDRQHPQAIEIINLAIDNYKILPLYQHTANPPTDYLDFTGSWSLKIPNFYPWYHEITGQGWII